MPYVFPHDGSAAELMRRYHDLDGWGQIIGPHGSGKSTLLHWLRRWMDQLARPVQLVSFQGGSEHRHAKAPDVRSWQPGTQLLVDGYEQLAWPWRWRLQQRCRRAGVRLIATTHRPLGLAVLYRTCATPELLDAIVAYLLGSARHPLDPSRPLHVLQLHAGGDSFSEVLSAGLLEARLNDQRGNIREMLLWLYDIYEQARRSDAGAAR